MNFINNKKILFKYGEKFSNAREIIIKLEMNLNYYKNIENQQTFMTDEDINDLKDVFSEAKSIYDELFDIEYKYYYQNENSLFLKIMQKESDLDSKFDFIEEMFKTTSEDFYIYNSEELKNLYLCNYMLNNYLITFFN